MIFIKVLAIVTTLIGCVGVGILPILVCLWPIARYAENGFRQFFMIGNSPHKLGEDKLPFIRLKNLIYWASGTLIFVIVSRICVFIANSWTAS